MKNSKIFFLIFAFLIANFSLAFAGNVHTGILYTPIATTPSTPTVTPVVISPIGGAYVLPGCTDPLALNFNKSANVSVNSSCIYAKEIKEIKEIVATTSPVAIQIASSTCPFFTVYQKKGDKGPEVLKIKTFLNTNEKESLELTDIFDEQTRQAVKRFQTKHNQQVLSPWSLKIATGWWYQSTRKKANDIVGCPERVRLDNGVLIE